MRVGDGYLKPSSNKQMLFEVYIELAVVVQHNIFIHYDTFCNVPTYIPYDVPW